MAIDWESKVGLPTTKVFGDPALYIPASVAIAPYDVFGVFDEGYREVVLLDTGSINTDAMPVIGITDGQFRAEPEQGDRITIVSVSGRPVNKTYYVKEVRPDRHGVTKLMLSKTYAP